ncbi:MAG: Imm1 family immunity protein [Snowella sp.]
MFISKFSSEDWQNNQNTEVIHPAKNWQEIEKAIQELDGKHRTLVTLETDGEAHLAISGGPDKFIVYLTFDNEVFYYLCGFAKSNLEESLVVGGQEGLYPAKFCVEIDLILQVAKTFAEFGTMDQTVVWEKEGVLELV